MAAMKYSTIIPVYRKTASIHDSFALAENRRMI
jgi:hypothetical protein